MGITEQEAINYLERHGYIADDVKDMCIMALEKHIPKKTEHIQGNPLWGYCPSCKKAISKGGSPIGCKWCLQRVSWEGEKEDATN